MLNGMTLNQLAAECHVNNAKWWHDLKTGERLDRNKGELLMLVVTELAEAVEGDRKNLMDDKLPHRTMVEVELADAVIRIADFSAGFRLDLDEVAAEMGELSESDIAEFPENFAEQMILITGQVFFAYSEFTFGDDSNGVTHIYTSLKCIEHVAKLHGLDLGGTYTEKSNFNKVRPDHQIENRLAENGKKY